MNINCFTAPGDGTSVIKPLALWGGLECTVARIGDEYRNQIRETGHDGRPGDLDQIAALGLRTLRYPVLLETISPEHLTSRMGYGMTSG